jgi:VWFA-related protein
VTSAVGRVFVLAVDVGSFRVDDSRGVVKAAHGFVQRLQPNDYVGLYTYPLGPRVDPTQDRAKLLRDLDTVVGGAQSLASRYHLTPAEVIDINAEMAAFGARFMTPSVPTRGQPTPVNSNDTETLRRVQLRECGSDTDARCIELIEQEAQAMAFFYEGEVTRAVNSLGELLRRLSNVPGRKTVVVLSAGMPVSDRLGGRPSIEDAARMLGEEAARSNSNIYAIHIDTSFLHTISAETQKNNKYPVSQERESVMMGRFLDQFAGTSGGTLMRVLVGSGEGAMDQILRETTSYYLLGVTPAESDRDGRTHRLKVKVDQRDTVVRSRTWLVIPKRS